MLSDLLKATCIDKLSTTRDIEMMQKNNKKVNNVVNADSNSGSIFSGTVTLPTFDGLENPSNAGGNKQTSVRQAMLMRIDHLFESDIQTKLSKSLLPSPPDLAEMLRIFPQTEDKSRRNLLNKPVVIGDAIPVPSVSNPDPTNTTTGNLSNTTNNANNSTVHESIEQMLQAALAHHNLGNFEESLKFLEAARIQLFSIEKVNKIKIKKKELEKQREYELDQQDSNDITNNKVSVTLEMIDSVTVSDDDVVLPIHLEMYIILCKGITYSGCDVCIYDLYLYIYN